MNPPLQGQRLVEGHYQAIPNEPTGGLYSEELGMELRFESSQLHHFHRGKQQRLLTEAEAAHGKIERLRGESAERRGEKKS